MKKSKLPSAETVGLNSGNDVLILAPRFSTLTIVEAVMIFSFCATSFSEVSKEGCAFKMFIEKTRRINTVSLFKGQDLKPVK